MNFIIFSIIGIIVLGIGIFMVYFSFGMISTNEIDSRMKEYIHEEGDESSPLQTTIETRDLAGSLFSRLLVPLFRRLGDWTSRYTPAGSIQEINRQLALAGYPMKLRAREFYGLRVMMLFLGLWLAFLFLRGGLDQNRMLIGLLILVLLYLMPVYWLRSLVTKQQDYIRKGLPDALDMLSVCATAGLGFDQAVQRVNDEWDTPISQEFGRMLSEMDLGISRSQALRNMDERLKISELSSFISVILQSEQLGMSISDTLQAQAEQMRIDRRFKAQEIAQKMPAKMLFPLAFLILPAIIAVLLGPSIPIFIDLFFNVLRP
ncbi:MAG: type II secretion system F family protein [Anaerolineae bacterium]|nr:type II secretion system F family protein [Anaerolineae bacterium]